MVDEVTSLLSPINILINNAGSLIERAALMAQTVTSGDLVMQLNLRSVLR